MSELLAGNTLFGGFLPTLSNDSVLVYDDSLRDSHVEHMDLQTATVCLMTSPLAITKPITWYSGITSGRSLFNTMTGTNTTHWGLRIRDHSYDLKRSASRSRIEAVPNAMRQEREVLTEHSLGITHFGDKRLEQIGLLSILFDAILRPAIHLTDN